MTILIPKPVGQIQIDAIKVYPPELLKRNKIIVADQSKNEFCIIKCLLYTNGCKTKNSPQLSLRICGPYHVERLLYYKKNPENWESWVEIVVPIEELPQLLRVLAETLKILQNKNKQK